MPADKLGKRQFENKSVTELKKDLEKRFQDLDLLHDAFVARFAEDQQKKHKKERVEPENAFLGVVGTFANIWTKDWFFNVLADEELEDDEEADPDYDPDHPEEDDEEEEEEADDEEEEEAELSGEEDESEEESDSDDEEED
jgi:cytoskeletal protein RodZ